MHIIIGELHLHATPIRVAMDLYTRIRNTHPAKQIIICLEIPNTDKNYIIDLYAAKKSLSDELCTLADNGNRTNTLAAYAKTKQFKGVYFSQNSVPVDFGGRKRILAYFDSLTDCIAKHTDANITGIDCMIKDSISTEGSKARSEYMFTKLIQFQQQGFFTISIIGQDHVRDFKNLLNKKSSSMDISMFHMFNVHDNEPITHNLPASYHESVKKMFTDLLGKQEQDGIKESTDDSNNIPVYSENQDNFCKIADRILETVFPTSAAAIADADEIAISDIQQTIGSGIFERNKYNPPFEEELEDELAGCSPS